MKDPSLTFDDTGHLGLDFGLDHKAWREPICAVCGEPVAWVLDMMSFTSPPHRLAHARCVWTPEAFASERNRGPA